MVGNTVKVELLSLPPEAHFAGHLTLQISWAFELYSLVFLLLAGHKKRLKGSLQLHSPKQCQMS